MLAEETPAASSPSTCSPRATTTCRELPFAERRARLEAVLGGDRRRCTSRRRPPTPRSPRDWFGRFEGAGLDGVVAKPLDRPYRQGKRAMLKVKHQRTADCVVAGFRMHKDGAGVGSLLLGLYDDDGTLHHVGVASSFAAPQRAGAVDELAPYRERRARRRTRGGSGPTAAAHEERRACRAAQSRWTGGQGPLVGAAAHRAGRRGRVRARAGRPVPPHGPVPALAPRPRAGLVHLRAARVGRPGGAARRVRRLTPPAVSVVMPQNPTKHARRWRPRPHSAAGNHRWIPVYSPGSVRRVGPVCNLEGRGERGPVPTFFLARSRARPSGHRVRE